MAQEKIFKNIDINDVNLYPFEVYKEYNVSSSNYTDSGYELNRAIIQLNNDNYPKHILPVSSTLVDDEPRNSDNKEQKLYYYHLKNFHYDKSYYSINKDFKNTLYYSSSIFSIPYYKLGEGIKRNTFQLTGSNNITLQDDGYGNIIDTTLTNTLIGTTNDIIYLTANNNLDDFNSIYYERHRSTNTKLTSNNITFDRGIVTDGSYEQICGKSLSFNTSSFIYLDDSNKDNIYNIDDDYSISLWVKPEVSGNAKSVLISKRNYKKTFITNTTAVTYNQKIIHESSSVFPFDISIISDSYIRVEANDGLNSIGIDSDPLSIYNKWHHIAYVKTGSVINLYVDNILETTTYDLTLNQNNNQVINIGDNFSGSIDQVRIYNKGLTLTEIGYLADNDYITGSFLQTNTIGNIFYNNGLVALNDIRPIYQSILFNSSESIDANNFNIQYRTTQTIYENEIICKIRKDEFNHTMNPSIRVNNDIMSSIPKSFATSSDFNPYVTEIGLYNDQHELLAIAKLAEPIPKLNNIDMSFLIRFDI